MRKEPSPIGGTVQPTSRRPSYFNRIECDRIHKNGQLSGSTKEEKTEKKRQGAMHERPGSGKGNLNLLNPSNSFLMKSATGCVNIIGNDGKPEY